MELDLIKSSNCLIPVATTLLGIISFNAYIKYVHPHADKVHPHADKAYPHADIRLSACGYRMRKQIITKLNPFNMCGILHVFMT